MRGAMDREVYTVTLRGAGIQNTTINLKIELRVPRRRALCLALKRAYEL